MVWRLLIRDNYVDTEVMNYEKRRVMQMRKYGCNLLIKREGGDII